MEKYHKPKQQFLTDVELLEKNKSGLERYRLKAGVYQIDFGFQNFGEHEDDWFNGASDSASDRRAPFKFDYGHSKVVAFTKDLFQEKGDFDKPENVRALADRFGKMIQSMSINEPEFNTSLSDIITSGKGMCDAKSTLFGSLLAKYTNLKAQAITGQYGKLKERVSYPFSHKWMRISDGKNVYLFDPMYKRFAAFQNDGGAFYPLDEEGSYFENLTPACYPAAKIMALMGIERFNGVQTVESHRDSNKHEVYVKNEDGLLTQLENNSTFAFEIKEDKELKVHNGAIKTGADEAALYFPIKSFQELK